MREILFRGFHECENGTQKVYYGGEWHKGICVEGYFCRAFRWTGDKYPVPAIQEADSFYFREVSPETVCQYTGLTDKNGKKIFEWDIFKFKDGYDKGVVKFGQYKSSFNHGPKNVGFFIDWERKDSYATLREDLGYWAESDDVEVIGNKFENMNCWR